MKEDHNHELADSWRNMGFAMAMLKYKAEKHGEKDYEKAIQWLETATEIDSSFAIAYNTTGYVYGMFKAHEKAIQQYKKAVDLDPLLPLPWYNMGYAYYHVGQTKRNEGKKDESELNFRLAVNYCDNAIRIDQKIPYAWYYKGFILYDGFKQYDEALRNFDKALEIDPRLPYAWYDKGSVYAKLGKYEKAIECFEQALRCVDDVNKKELDVITKKRLHGSFMTKGWFSMN